MDIQTASEKVVAARKNVLAKLLAEHYGDCEAPCQQACPAQAIVFGDANDPDSRLTGQTASGRAFRVLEELNVKPNVTYLARVRNPNPEVRGDDGSSDEGHEA